MMGRFCAYTFMLSFFLPISVYCDVPDAEATAADEDLVAFVQLGSFSDRGMLAYFIRKSDALKLDAESSPVNEGDVPKEVLELLKLRDNNLSDKACELPWPIESKDHTVNATMHRFRAFGPTELFNIQDTRLLNSPLTTRKELMERFTSISEKASLMLKPIYVKGLTNARMVLIAGSLRSLSLELDYEVINALSPDERLRVSKLVSYVLPSAISDMRSWNRKFKLGAVLLEGLSSDPLSPNSK